MELEHRFELPVGVEKAFPALLDLDVIGPCFPGATVDSVDGDTFTGSVKVKIGPVPLNYKGTARFVEKNYENHTAVIEANGSAPRSGSTATMLVHAAANGIAPNRTAVVLLTTLSITGRAATFTRQAMIDVGNELIGKFADGVSKTLTGKVAGGATLLGVVNPDLVAAEVVADEFDVAPAVETDAAPAPASAPHAGRPTARAARPSTEPIQLLSAARKPLFTQLLPVLGGLVLGAIILFRKGKTPAERIAEKSVERAKTLRSAAEDTKKAAKNAKKAARKSDKSRQKDAVKSARNLAEMAVSIADSVAAETRKTRRG